MNNIDAKITAWQLGPVTIMRGTATPGRDVTHPECFGRFTVIALSPAEAIRKCLRRVARMCADCSACEQPTRHPRRKNPPASATIEEKVKESQQTVENKPFPTYPPRRERLRESKSPHLLAEARVVQQASIAPAKGRG